MATKSANFPANMAIAGYKPVEHDELEIGNDFATTSGDRVANNHQHVRGKSLGVETDAMKKYGRNIARAMNQGD
jgi:hypothetical protein